MKTLSLSHRKGERGFTITEVLVASAIFVVIFVAALLIYDRSNKVFKSGVESSDMQQNTRVGFDKLVSDVRLAGFDFDRDGIPFGSSGAVWQKLKAYGTANIVSPTVANGFSYQAKSPGGTTGGTEPTWNKVIGGSTVDGTVTWTTLQGVNQYQQPDEQIEYAHPHAITLRANFDFENHAPCVKYPGTTCGNGRAPEYESAEFPVVTTSNDEIVTYALKSDQTGAGVNLDSIKFFADLPDRRAFPGGRAENERVIDGVDLCTGLTGCSKPPYTLYRITLNNDKTSPQFGNPVFTPLANNVRSLDFTYFSDSVGDPTAAMTFSATGITSAPFAGGASSGGGKYSPITPSASAEIRAQRARIHSVRVNLTGMNQSPDRNYVNPAEPVATITDALGNTIQGYRTYRLESLVVPRNIGKIGQQEQQESPPGAPALKSVCMAACGMALVSWLAPPDDPLQGSVEQYVVFYDTVTPPVRFQKQVGSTTAWIDGLTPGQTYYFRVASVNSFGATVGAAILGAYDPKNATTPEDLTALHASGNGPVTEPPAEQNQISLSWTLPAALKNGGYTCYQVNPAGSNVPGVGIGLGPGEVGDYQVMRSTDPNFNPGTAASFTLISNTALYPLNSLTLGLTQGSFLDQTASPCVDYYYRIRGIKAVCFPKSGTNNTNPQEPSTLVFPPNGTPAIHGIATASGNPIAPASLTEPLPTNVATTSGCSGPTCTAYLQWPKVLLDDSTPAKPLVVTTYRIHRQVWKDDGTGTGTYIFDTESDLPDVPDTTVGSATLDVTTGVANNPYYTDAGLASLEPVTNRQYQYRYTVRAVLPCTPEKLGALSTEYRLCPYVGAAPAITAPGVLIGNGSAGAPWESVSSGSALQVTDATGTTVSKVQVVLTAGATLIDLGTKATSPNFVFPLTGLDPGTVYSAYFIVYNASGCQKILLRYVQGGTPSGCCLSAQRDDPFVVQYTQNTSDVTIFLKNQCGNPLNLQSSGISISYDRALNASPAARVTSIDFPTAAGGFVNQPITDSAAGAGVVTLPAITPPGTAKSSVDANTVNYRLVLHFDNILTNTIQPLTNTCIKYVRPGIDDISGGGPQFCRIVPGPNATVTDFSLATACN